MAEHVATAVRLIDEGKLKVPVAAVYPLTAAKEAMMLPGSHMKARNSRQRGGKPMAMEPDAAVPAIKSR